MIIVTGIHRSGTTFLGSLLKQTGKFCYLHEPFNRKFGIEGVDLWYPYVSLRNSEHQDFRHTVKMLESLYSGEIVFKQCFSDKDQFLKRLARNIIRSRGHLDFLRYTYLYPGRELLVKDPFLALCAGALAMRHSNVKIINVVRHPAAVYNSAKRMNWEFDLKVLWSQINLRRELDLPNDFPDFKNKIHLQIAWLWNTIYRSIREQKDVIGEQSFIVRHEDLSVNPYEVGQNILDFIGAPMNENIRSFIERNMFDRKISAKEGKLHDFSRDSAAMALSWKNNLSDEVSEIISVCRQTLDFYYPEKQFNI